MTKKMFFCSLLMVLVSFALYAEGIAEKAPAANERSDVSYAFGMLLASDFVDSGMEFNYSALIRGFRETMEAGKTRFSIDEAMEMAQAAFYAAMERQADISKQNETLFFEENGRRNGVITTESGLQYEEIIAGTGKQPLVTDYVKVNYVGALLNGAVFDSSHERGEPEEFPLHGVIPGFSEGIRMMKTGGKSRLFIPSELAYGSRGIGGIPPNSTLVFEVDLLEIVDKAQDVYDLDFDYYGGDESESIETEE